MTLKNSIIGNHSWGGAIYMVSNFMGRWTAEFSIPGNDHTHAISRLCSMQEEAEQDLTNFLNTIKEGTSWRKLESESEECITTHLLPSNAVEVGTTVLVDGQVCTIVELGANDIGCVDIPGKGTLRALCGDRARRLLKELE